MIIIKVYKSLSALLFYITLIFIIAGINFSGINEADRSPGWFIQTLPVNDDYLDLFFLDTLHVWMVSKGYPGTQDTGYIIHTYNGGYNWVVQKAEPQLFRKVQFLDTNYGYVAGGNTLATIQKTTNGGLNWTDITGSMSSKFGINDMSFINKDTGWICINDLFDGGVYKTVNGGINWVLQKYDGRAYLMQFINKDTGWYSSDESKLYRTIDGGNNWLLQYTNLTSGITSLFFLNGNLGWIRAGDGSGTAVLFTINGGFNWNGAQGFTSGWGVKFLNTNTGYAGVTFPPAKITKTTNGGLNWGYQITPYITKNLISPLRNDTLNTWSGQLMRTTDGGGPIIYVGIKKGEHFIPAVELHQNYPNPFNPSTKIRFEVNRSSYVELIIYDITGKEIETLLDNKLYSSPGMYEVYFDANEYSLSSGVYFYKIKTETENHKEIFIDTKKLMFVK